jgi:hypothetical protein
MVAHHKHGYVPPALALGLGAAACHETHHHPPPPPPPPVHSFVEVEPNDIAPLANYLGGIAVGETFFVRGFIGDSGFDPFDGFAWTTAEPMEIELHLWIDDPYADLDVCYFNPYSGLIEACFATSSNPESGWLALYGGTDFHLVVSSYFGDSSYTLELVGRPLGFALAAPVAAEAAANERRSAFEAYGGSTAPETDGEPRAPSVRGRWILLDLEEGSSAAQEFALGPEGLTAGPPRRSP